MALRKLPYSQVVKIASFYRNPAWGRRTQPKFCNTVVALRTRLTPQQLLGYCQKIECQQGRIRKIKWGARTLDIDILLYGYKKIKNSTLEIPHPRIAERDFVRLPLQEIAPRMGGERAGLTVMSGWALAQQLLLFSSSINYTYAN